MDVFFSLYSGVLIQITTCYHAEIQAVIAETFCSVTRIAVTRINEYSSHYGLPINHTL